MGSDAGFVLDILNEPGRAAGEKGGWGRESAYGKKLADTSLLFNVDPCGSFS